MRPILGDADFGVIEIWPRQRIERKGGPIAGQNKGQDQPNLAGGAKAEKKKKAAKEKKRAELKGGLDFDYWNKKL